MNFEVMCIVDGCGVVDKEYFDTYEDALKFQLDNQDMYNCVSITPMNEYAETVLRRYE